MSKICVVSLGSMGIALGKVLFENGHNVTIWGRDKAKVDYTSKNRRHPNYLSDIYINENIAITHAVDNSLKDFDYYVFATPVQGLRNILTLFSNYIPKNAIIISAAKGLEKDTLLRPSQIINEVCETYQTVAFSGPGHAEEIALRLPSAYVSSSIDSKLAEEVQNLFMTSYFRIYTNDDLIGCELGGALKNVYAIAAGISDGVGNGDNAKAALMTRGIYELSKLGVALGGNQATFSNLTGIGDLIVTCTSEHSRNRRAGLLIGQGKSLKEVELQINMVVEGIYTTQAVYELAKLHKIEMPIVNEIYSTLFLDKPVHLSLKNLMEREKKEDTIILRSVNDEIRT